MKKLIIIISLFAFFLPLTANAQLDIQVKNQSLVDVLQILHYEYGLSYSYSSEIGVNCKLSIAASFPTIEDVLQAILPSCQLDYQQIGDVYVIKKQKTVKTYRLFKGQLIDAQSGEPLSSVVIAYEGGKTRSDNEGYFSIELPYNQANLKFSHITYQRKDTLLTKGVGHKVSLLPESLELEEVVISEQGKPEAYSPNYPLVKAWEEGQLVKGFYRNFDEFINNRPSQAWQIYPDQRLHHGLRQKELGANNIEFQISRDSARALGQILGFCDGQNVYINLDQPSFKRWSTFAKLRFVGPFAYYTFEEVGGLFGSERYEMLIDLHTGEIHELTKSYLRDLLKQRPHLAIEFEQILFKAAFVNDYFFKLYDEVVPAY